MLVYTLFIIGFIILIRGGALLVSGAASLARKLNISHLVIGLTVVAFGTSSPEFIVNIIASAKGSTDIAIGNVLGSNIANILLILGIAALIRPMTVYKNTIWKEIPLSLLAALVLGFLVNDALIDGLDASILTRIDGLVLLSFLAIFMYYIFGIAKDNEAEEHNGDIKDLGIFQSIVYVFLGLVGLTVGGEWIVNGAIHMAQTFGISESLIALTIIAIGTSLPELAASIAAVIKSNTDIAIGNVVGSSILNIFWILGVSSVIRPLPFHTFNNIDIGMVVLANILLFSFMFIGRRHILEKKEGVLFILIYLGYISFVIMRG